MRPGDPTDPLLRQVLPLADELADVPGFAADPVDDADGRRAAGLLHKYDGRVLLVTHRGLRGPLPLLLPPPLSVRRRARSRSPIGSRRSTRSPPTNRSTK